jgi:hypothetical protein
VAVKTYKETIFCAKMEAENRIHFLTKKRNELCLRLPALASWSTGDDFIAWAQHPLHAEINRIDLLIEKAEKDLDIWAQLDRAA